jgi:hypothetical protein
MFFKNFLKIKDKMCPWSICIGLKYTGTISSLLLYSRITPCCAFNIFPYVCYIKKGIISQPYKCHIPEQPKTSPTPPPPTFCGITLPPPHQGPARLVSGDVENRTRDVGACGD